MSFQFRDYQWQATGAIYDYFGAKSGNPVVAMPTGTGKSVVIALLTSTALQRWPNQRFLWATHVQELVGQNVKAMLRAWPEAPVGVYSASLKRKELGQPITFGGIASIRNNPEAFGHVDIFGIDECHLLSPNNDTMYQQTIEALRRINPYMKTVGLSATPYRMGQGLITDPPRDGKALFTDFAIDMTGMHWFNWFIDQGYLSKLVTMPTDTELDVSGVGMSGGDFAGGALNAKLDGQDKEHYNACREMVARGFNRKAWLVFTAGIERAEWVSDTLNTMGVKATFVHSKIEPGEREKRIAAYRAGEYQCMVGNNIFTTGFDYAGIDLIGMLRPTMSTGLWVQMLGRGTRPLYAPGIDLSTAEGRLWAIQLGGKVNCLVLDFAGNAKELGPVNDPVLPHKKGPGTGDIPMKICPSCGCYQHLSARVCDNCGAAFPPGLQLSIKAFNGDLIKREEAVYSWYNVTATIYRVHQKGGGKPMVRVTYACGFRSFDDWVCIEHDGWLGKKARNWWRTRVKQPEYLNYGTPPTAVDLVEWKHILKTPKRIYVQTNKEYPEVENYEYE